MTEWLELHALLTGYITVSHANMDTKAQPYRPQQAPVELAIHRAKSELHSGLGRMLILVIQDVYTVTLEEPPIPPHS
jgi:hypothetical protein